MTERSLKSITPDSITGMIFAMEGMRNSIVLLNGPMGCRFYHSTTSQFLSIRPALYLPEEDSRRRVPVDYNYLNDWFFRQARVPCTYLDGYDYVIDAVDSLKHKTLLILNASASKAKFFCSLGAALKVDPRRIKVAEFWSVRGCPLGAALRKRMKKAGTLPSSRFLCVYDDEVLPNRGASENCLAEESSFGKAQVNGSLVHITSMFGMTLAGLVVEDIYKAVVK